jgi:DNA polymerase/3'-5' exonuclease PolX
VAVDPKATRASVEKFGPVTLHSCPVSRFGAVLVHATGDERHVAQLAKIARTKGLSLTAEGLSRGIKQLSAAREEDVYETLGVPSFRRSCAKAETRLRKPARGLCRTW